MKEKLLLLEDILERTLKKKIYKYVNSLSKNVSIDKLADLVNE